MISDHAKRIINKCETQLQLNSCVDWVKYIYKESDLTEALAVISQRRNQLEKDMVDGHQMD